MHAVRFPFQLHDGGHVVQYGHRQRRVAEVVGPGLEVDVGHQGSAGALTAGVDDLISQAGGLRADGAFGAIEAEFINADFLSRLFRRFCDFEINHLVQLTCVKTICRL